MGGTVTYKFVSTPGEKERFHVDPKTGLITTADVSIMYLLYLPKYTQASNKRIDEKRAN